MKKLQLIIMLILLSVFLSLTGVQARGFRNIIPQPPVDGPGEIFNKSELINGDVEVPGENLGLPVVEGGGPAANFPQFPDVQEPAIPDVGFNSPVAEAGELLNGDGLINDNIEVAGENLSLPVIEGEQAGYLLLSLQPGVEENGSQGEEVVEFIVNGLTTPPEIFFKILTGEEDLTYVAETSTGNPLFDTLMIPVDRFVLIATGEEEPSYFAEPTGFELFDTLLVPVGIFLKVFTGEEDLTYVADTSMGNPLFDTLMIPVDRFVLIATGEEEPSYFAEPTGFELFDTLLVPVGIFLKVFTGEEDLTYVADTSMGNPLFDTLMIPVDRFVLIATGEEEPSYFAEPTGFELFDTLLVPVGIFFEEFSGEE